MHRTRPNPPTVRMIPIRDNIVKGLIEAIHNTLVVIEPVYDYTKAELSQAFYILMYESGFTDAQSDREIKPQ